MIQSEINFSEWISLLEPIEQGFCRQSFHLLQSNNGDGDVIPPTPPGMSDVRANTLYYHCKGLLDGIKGRRKIEHSKPHSIRLTDNFKRELDFEAALMKLTWTDYIMRCINAGRSQVQAFPDNKFEHPVLQPNYGRRNP